MPVLTNFTDALTIVKNIEINPDSVHPLQWGKLWVNLRMLHVTNFEWPDDTWADFLEHVAFPEYKPLPKPIGLADLATHPYYLNLIKTVNDIYEEGDAK